jgi:hypothetical protein
MFTDPPPRKAEGFQKVDGMIAGAHGLTDPAARRHVGCRPENHIVPAVPAHV